MGVRISGDVAEKVRAMLSELEHPVSLKLFKPREEEKLEVYKRVEAMLKFVEGLSDKVTLTVYEEDSPEAERYNVMLFPAVLVHGKEEYGICFYGFPGGYEFGAFINAVLMASKGSSGLGGDLEEKMLSIKLPVQVMVFTTPTCPYCPVAVRNACRLAIANRLIRTEVISAVDFPDLADAYSVFQVPKIVIRVEGEVKNEFEGAVPLRMLALGVLRAASSV